MRPCPQPLMTVPRQLSLLPVLTGPGRLPPDERREVVALLAALLTEAARAPTPETANDGE
jgi:hypothetical protein